MSRNRLDDVDDVVTLGVVLAVGVALAVGLPLLAPTSIRWVGPGWARRPEPTTRTTDDDTGDRVG